uniref:NUDIX hydrolase n=1 Tax=Halomonas sp. TaxID=1486246 RepID=UPI0026032FD4|nr:NUDIX domain-containing protein [Halomonas sp.]
MATSDTLATRTLHIAAALILDGRGRLLLVRKRGTQAFMQAGGKIEPDETPEAALRRELKEELGGTPAQIHYLCEAFAPAANEPGYRVHAHLFNVTMTGELSPAAEIETLHWATPQEARQLPLAALTRDHVLPLAESLVLQPLV